VCSTNIGTYFSQDAVSAATDEERLVKVHDVIQQLPPPHYRLDECTASSADEKKNCSFLFIR